MYQFKFFIVLKNQEKAPEPAKYDPDRCSLILYSGGTTGAPHGIMLSDKNINAIVIFWGEDGNRNQR